MLWTGLLIFTGLTFHLLHFTVGSISVSNGKENYEIFPSGYYAVNSAECCCSDIITYKDDCCETECTCAKCAASCCEPEKSYQVSQAESKLLKLLPPNKPYILFNGGQQFVVYGKDTISLEEYSKEYSKQTGKTGGEMPILEEIVLAVAQAKKSSPAGSKPAVNSTQRTSIQFSDGILFVVQAIDSERIVDTISIEEYCRQTGKTMSDDDVKRSIEIATQGKPYKHYVKTGKSHTASHATTEMCEHCEAKSDKAIAAAHRSSKSTNVDTSYISCCGSKSNACCAGDQNCHKIYGAKFEIFPMMPISLNMDDKIGSTTIIRETDANGKLIATLQKCVDGYCVSVEDSYKSKIKGNSNLTILSDNDKEIITIKGYGSARLSDYDGLLPVLQERPDAHKMVKAEFSNVWVALLYVLFVMLVCFHLNHAIQSAFHTIGIEGPKFTPIMRVGSIILAITLFFLFTALPFAIMTGNLLNWFGINSICGIDIYMGGL